MRHRHPFLSPLLAAVLMLSTLVLLAGTLITAPGGQAQASLIQVAAPPLGEVAWQYAGDAAFDDDTFALAARLTAVNALDATSVKDRFALAGSLTMTQSGASGQSTTWTGVGPLTVYAHDTPLPPVAGAAAMRAGVPVAAYEATVILSQISSTAGEPVYTGTIALRQTAAYVFPLDGVENRFGQLELGLNASLTGGVTNTPTRLAVFGAAPVSNRPASPADSGPAPTVAASGDTSGTDAATPAPTTVPDPTTEPAPTTEAAPTTEPAPTTAPVAPGNDCATWVTDTTARLSAAADQRAVLLSGQDLTAEDVDNALANIQLLIAEQQASPAPEAGATASSLALSTLATDARALQLVQSAFASGDQATLEQATAILNDAENLSQRALTTLTEVAAACGE